MSRGALSWVAAGMHEPTPLPSEERVVSYRTAKPLAPLGEREGPPEPVEGAKQWEGEGAQPARVRMRARARRLCRAQEQVRSWLRSPSSPSSSPASCA